MTRRTRLFLGKTPVWFSTIGDCFWTFWGITENFLDGWYYRSRWAMSLIYGRGFVVPPPPRAARRNAESVRAAIPSMTPIFYLMPILVHDVTLVTKNCLFAIGFGSGVTEGGRLRKHSAS